VAAQAALSKAAIYRYFPSKAALFVETVRIHARDALGEETIAAGFFPDTPERQFERFLRNSWAALRRPALAQLIRLVHAERAAFPEGARLFQEEVIRILQERLARVLENGRARGVFRTLPSHYALQAIPALLVQHALNAGDEAGTSDGEILAGLNDLLLNGLLRRGSRHDAE
jgi:AcrR family transcriptional regulator